MSQKPLRASEVAQTSGTALKLYMILVDRALRLGKTRLRVKRESLAKALGYTQVRGVSKALTVLARAGWIVRTVRCYKNPSSPSGFRSLLIISLVRLRKQLKASPWVNPPHKSQRKPRREPPLVDRIISDLSVTQ